MRLFEDDIEQECEKNQSQKFLLLAEACFSMCYFCPVARCWLKASQTNQDGTMVQFPGRFWCMTIFGHRALVATHSFPASPYLAMTRYHNFWDNKLRSVKMFVLNAGMSWSSKIGHNSSALAYSVHSTTSVRRMGVCVSVSCVPV